MSSFAAYQRLDAQLASAGFLPTTPWWLAQLERFYAHPTARTLIARVGRGGTKSTTAVKFALTELLFGSWPVPPGERHFAVFVSVRSDEALQRLRQAKAMLDALRLAARQAGDQLELEDLPLGVKTLPATIGAVSGYRAICDVADEAAKWRSADSSANPAREVLASLKAMRVTRPGSRRLVVSSPFGTLDEHHRLVELGNTAEQLVAIAPSWVANPSISEEQTRREEPDERVWLREYAAIPQAEASAAWPSEIVERAFRAMPDGLTPAVAFGVDDPSSGRRDAWVSIVARIWFQKPQPRVLSTKRYTGVRNRDGDPIYVDEPILDAKGREQPNPAYRGPAAPLLVVERVEATEGAFWRGLPAGELVRRRAEMYRAHGVDYVLGDQREAYLLESSYAANGIRYVSLPWTAESKVRAVERLRRWLADETLILPANDRLKRELLGFQERVLPSGHITFEGRSTDDHVAVLITAALADCEGLIPASPLQKRSYSVRIEDLPDMS